MRIHFALSSVCLWAALAAPTAVAADLDPQQVEFFEKKIRPLLSDHCFECHGRGKTKGGLSLETSPAAQKGGDSGAAVVPGQPGESLLIKAITYDGDIKMPPKGRLSDAEIADLTKWIEKGAVWPAKDAKPQASGGTAEGARKITAEDRAFWSFRPIADHALPPVRDTAWPKTAIDRFILATLEEKGLKPSSPADKRTLIRRATFDLIGLPPTPEEIETFVNDSSSDAFAKVIDRLLSSPHYGERWGRHWLDVARYGEDQAHTFQARLYPNGYRYRDWVVQALNDDMPYDRFVREQIAGDLLDGPKEKETDRQIALGYFALGPVYYADAGCGSKANADQLDDRVDTLARGFLGLTVACARCHDHKFDPITQQDYFALAGIFASTNYREAPLAPPDVVAAYDQAQEKVKQQDDAIKKFLDTAAVNVAEAAAKETGKYLVAAWKLSHPAKDQPAPSRSKVAKAEGLHEFILEKWQGYLVPQNKGKLPQFDPFFDALATKDAPAATTDSSETEPAKDAVPPEVAKAAEAVQNEIVAAFADRDALEKQYADALAAASEAEKSKVAKPSLDKPKADLLAALTGARSGLCALPKDKVEGSLSGDMKKQLGTLRSELDQLKKDSPPKYPVAHSLADGTVGNMKIHIRGNPAKTGDEVPRRFLALLAGDNPPPFTQGSGRLELARAIASPDNPLTARVIVNRVWQEHFGRGIVATASNFGALGERPTHPALLDYLARRLIAQGWSLKTLHREIMLSATYQQGGGYDAKSFAIDADNKFLWRMNRRRLDVEAWRDALLAASGNLDRKLGGPSGKLEDADYNRRTLYASVSRHNLDSLLRLFDFPDPNITSQERTRTTVPLQQLFVLNSDFMIRQSKSLAARLTAASDTDDASRIRRAFLTLYGRPATDAEVQLGVEFLASPESTSGEVPAVKTSLSRWEQYAQVLLGANEFTFVD